MKRNLFFLFAAFVLGSFFLSCNKDEDPVNNPPAFISATLSEDNTEITVVFSEAVYAESGKTGALTGANFAVTLTGGTLTGATYSVAHTAGSDEAVFTFEYEGKVSGTEVISMKPKTVYDSEGTAMATSQEVSVTLVDLGVVGEWYSSDDNVSFLLSDYFHVDSIYAKFDLNNTYSIESFDIDGIKTKYVGTYTQSKSSVGEIWDLQLNQTVPTVTQNIGIFEVLPNESDFDMTFEVVQTQPDIGNSAPTADAGFGSSNGGGLGAINIQKFKRIK